LEAYVENCKKTDSIFGAHLVMEQPTVNIEMLLALYSPEGVATIISIPLQNSVSEIAIRPAISQSASAKKVSLSCGH